MRTPLGTASAPSCTRATAARYPRSPIPVTGPSAPSRTLRGMLASARATIARPSASKSAPHERTSFASSIWTFVTPFCVASDIHRQIGPRPAGYETEEFPQLGINVCFVLDRIGGARAAGPGDDVVEEMNAFLAVPAETDRLLLPDLAYIRPCQQDDQPVLFETAFEPDLPTPIRVNNEAYAGAALFRPRHAISDGLLDFDRRTAASPLAPGMCKCPPAAKQCTS